jgi:hypothetical protein
MHYYEKNIVDIKKEYTEYLLSIMSPYIYEGFMSMYNEALNNEIKYIEESKNNPNVKNPGILILFQLILQDVPNLNENKIKQETDRIKEASKTSDIFDKLVKAVFKSYIVLLSYNSCEKKCEIVNSKYHENINIYTFIHTCYIETARILYDHPDLFWHKFKSNEVKHNQRIIYQLINVSIKKAIKILLPMKEILDEYLNNDYIESDTNDNSDNSNSNYIHKKNKKHKYKSVEQMIKKQNKYKNKDSDKLVITTEENKFDVDDDNNDDFINNNIFDDIINENIENNNIVNVKDNNITNINENNIINIDDNENNNDIVNVNDNNIINVNNNDIVNVNENNIVNINENDNDVVNMDNDIINDEKKDVITDVFINGSELQKKPMKENNKSKNKNINNLLNNLENDNYDKDNTLNINILRKSKQ